MTAGGIYHHAIISLANAGTGHGTLATPDARARRDNPLCGDRVDMQVQLAGSRIAALAHDVKGCLLCRAAAAVIGRRAAGADLQDIEGVMAAVCDMLEQQSAPPAGWDELVAFMPVHGHRSRYRCVLLPFEALAAALRDHTQDEAR